MVHSVGEAGACLLRPRPLSLTSPNELRCDVLPRAERESMKGNETTTGTQRKCRPLMYVCFAILFVFTRNSKKADDAVEGSYSHGKNLFSLISCSSYSLGTTKDTSALTLFHGFLDDNQSHFSSYISSYDIVLAKTVLLVIPCVLLCLFVT